MVVHFVGRVKHFFSVLCTSWNIIGTVDQDYVIILTIIIAFNHFIIEGIHCLIIRELIRPERHKELVGAPGLLIVNRIFQSVEVLAD